MLEVPTIPEIPSRLRYFYPPPLECYIQILQKFLPTSSNRASVFRWRILLRNSDSKLSLNATNNYYKYFCFLLGSIIQKSNYKNRPHNNRTKYQQFKDERQNVDERSKSTNISLHISFALLSIRPSKKYCFVLNN